MSFWRRFTRKRREPTWDWWIWNYAIAGVPSLCLWFALDRVSKKNQRFQVARDEALLVHLQRKWEGPATVTTTPIDSVPDTQVQLLQSRLADIEQKLNITSKDAVKATPAPAESQQPPIQAATSPDPPSKTTSATAPAPVSPYPQDPWFRPANSLIVNSSPYLWRNVQEKKEATKQSPEKLEALVEQKEATLLLELQRKLARSRQGDSEAPTPKLPPRLEARVRAHDEEKMRELQEHQGKVPQRDRKRPPLVSGASTRSS